MISIMNAGRGAGKTYALIQWAKEADNRYVVGTYDMTGDAMEDAGLYDKFVHYVHAKAFFQGRRNVEVAFDNFEYMLGRILGDEYGINQYTSNVLLSTNFADAGLIKQNPFPAPDDWANRIIDYYSTDRPEEAGETEATE